MKKLFKKNQIIITALALMIAAAGYLSYTNSGIGGDEVTQTSGTAENGDYDIVARQTLTDEEIYAEIEDTAQDAEENAGNDAQTAQTDADTAIDNPGETVLTSASSNVDFAVEARLNREQVRAQSKENLMEVINSTALSDAEKQAAVDKMVALADTAQKEADAQMLLEAKGFSDVVVSITENSADVVLDMGDVTDAKRAQIEDIVKRKTKVSAENIVITPITAKEESGQ